MALWQVTFYLFPQNLILEVDDIPEQKLRAYVRIAALHGISLPHDYEARLAEILPVRDKWSPKMEAWGHEESDDIEIWRNNLIIAAVHVRIDVRKLDNQFLTRLLSLVNSWSCVLVESRYRKVCQMEVRQLRALIAGHPHSRAMKDPENWLPVLMAELKNKEDE